MLFKRRFHDGLASGRITLAFRRWRRPSVRAGGRLQTAAGVLGIDAVDVIDESDITEADARKAGFPSRAELVAELGEGQGTLYRVAFHRIGEDPRIALRQDAALDESQIVEIGARLARLDAASPRGPWTREALTLIAARPAVRAADLAASLGRDTMTFKLDVRKLKALGLTESLEVGYRISPRGRAVLQRLAPREPS
jgi:hypothetical protein